jgi:cell division protein ZapE
MNERPDKTSQLLPTKELTLEQINVAANIEQIVEAFVPTPRFAHVSFDNYRPDPRQPSQTVVVDRLRHYVGDININTEPRRGFLRLRARTPERSGPAGLYLDGGFGVGKTHLLAAAYFAAPAPKAYLSFEELTYTIGALGMQASLQAFASYRLICIDEFELDDVGNTMLAKTFIRAIMQGRSHFITTSNTLPTELGQGRFAADDFKREIGEIAAAFEAVRIEGDDYRHRPRDADHAVTGPLSTEALRGDYTNYKPGAKAKLYTTFKALSDKLASFHPIHFAQLLEPLEIVFIEDLTTIENQMVALRFVHFIDKLYDQQVQLKLSASCTLPELFAADYRDKGYAKKYRRCLSRLHELLQESAAL